MYLEMLTKMDKTLNGMQMGLVMLRHVIRMESKTVSCDELTSIVTNEQVTSNLILNGEVNSLLKSFIVMNYK